MKSGNAQIIREIESEIQNYGFRFVILDRKFVGQFATSIIAGMPTESPEGYLGAHGIGLWYAPTGKWFWPSDSQLHSEHSPTVAKRDSTSGTKTLVRQGFMPDSFRFSVPVIRGSFSLLSIDQLRMIEKVKQVKVA